VEKDAWYSTQSRLIPPTVIPACRQAEEPQAVLSNAKEGSPYLLDSRNAGILRFAQKDSLPGFFNNLQGFRPSMVDRGFPQCP
jgi:hypothetical protein